MYSMRTRSSLTFLIYGNFRSTRSPDYDCFILISSQIWFEGVKENTYNSGDIVYSYNITLGGKELEVLNHLKINGLREDFDPVSNCNSGLNTDVIALCCKSQAGSRIDMQARQKKLSSPVPVITRQALLEAGPTQSATEPPPPSEVPCPK